MRLPAAFLALLPFQWAAADSRPAPEADCGDICTKLAVPLASTGSDPQACDFRPLHELVKHARVIGLAERTHLPEFRALRNRVFRYLVSEEGVTAIAVETPFTLAVAVDDYVLGRRALSDEIIGSVFFGGAPVEENRQLIKWMRAYNDSASTKRKLHFYGIDLGGRADPRLSMYHFGREALDAALKYVKKVDAVRGRSFSRELTPLLSRFNREAYASLSRQERDRITVGIADLIGLFERQHVRWIARSSSEEYERAFQRAVVARHLDANRRAKGWDEANELDDWEGSQRDAGMLDNVRWALEREGRQGRLFLFAANSHLTKTPSGPNSFTSLGEHLREALGDAYVAMGTFRDFSWDHPQPGRMQNLARVKINKVVWSVIDRVESPLFFIDLHRLPQRQWFPDDDWQPLDAFDAMIFIDTRRLALEPLS